MSNQNESYDECLSRLESAHGDILPGSFITCEYISPGNNPLEVSGLVIIVPKRMSSFYLLLSRSEVERLCQNHCFMKNHIVNSQLLIKKNSRVQIRFLMDIEDMLSSSWDDIREVGSELFKTLFV